MATLGVPYSEKEIKNALKNIEEQSKAIETNLYNDPEVVKSFAEAEKNSKVKGEEFVPLKDREIVAMIAYLQRLGADLKVKK